ncbi:HipA domain-containing protein [Variovorax sp. YR216]|uniref:HipA domain-containing protein n=1 Tax=Variovorax sp. YR216 TaxID=1882828 RepID=UPI00089CF07F|nr:HipA domain-containing protein [Variovorax sp. YR216]SEB17783.1 serine/threonine-protein kinase HipA [Variovorax sp. YR216]
MSDYVLEVFSDTRRLGTLQYEPEHDDFSLNYDPEWVASPVGYALSPQLPLNGSGSSRAIRRFLENLLPEGVALDVASRDARVTRNNIFGLIRHLGHETAGALSFLPPNGGFAEQETMRRALPFEELEQRIADRANRPFNIWDGKVRMSIAGHQDKLLVERREGRLFLVDGSLSSTHILKPEPFGVATPCMVANEHYCMSLANRMSHRRFGSDMAAAVEILRMPSPVLSVERFDRSRKDDRIERLHIIDGCQALDLSVAAKYERNLGDGPQVQHIRDGASFEKLGALRSLLVEPALGMQRIAIWAVTTLLFGNSDAHGKNISFRVTRAGLSVTALYDLVSVVQYDRFDHSLAMAFGDVFALEEVRAFALADFCERLGVPRPYFARELTRLCRLAIEEAPAQAKEPAYQGDEVKFVAQLAGYVAARAQALLAMASDIAKFKADNF